MSDLPIGPHLEAVPLDYGLGLLRGSQGQEVKVDRRRSDDHPIVIYSGRSAEDDTDVVAVFTLEQVFTPADPDADAEEGGDQ